MARFVSERSIINKRASLYNKLMTYESRRNALRIKHNLRLNVFPKAKAPLKYLDEVRNINNKIRLWKAQLRRLDTINNKIIFLGNAVAYFTGFNVKDSGKNFSIRKDHDRLLLAKSLFYKYGLENGLGNKDLREYVGAKKPSQPADYRKMFTLMFKKDQEYKQKWLNFKQYYESLKPHTDDFIDKRRAPGS